MSTSLKHGGGRFTCTSLKPLPRDAHAGQLKPTARDTIRRVSSPISAQPSVEPDQRVASSLPGGDERSHTRYGDRADAHQPASQATENAARHGPSRGPGGGTRAGLFG